MTVIRAWAAPDAHSSLMLSSIEFGPLGEDEVEVAVEYCGICHSDISMLENQWNESVYPLVPGHEVVGCIVAIGSNVTGLHCGQYVGIGWTSGSCMRCHSCLTGDQHLCANAKSTIIGRHGGFAERIRTQAIWAVPLPETLDNRAAAPLFCGGLTVFSPFLAYNIRPTDRVGIVGIGGLGHLAIKFARAWGCEVTAFTSSPSKHEECLQLGAHRTISTHDTNAIQRILGELDFLLITSNVPLPWEELLSTLAPKGRLHIVGVVLTSIPVQALSLISGQKNISGSPTGSPADIATMLHFCTRHNILPTVEYFPMSSVNDALARLKEGKARYRIVLEADF